MGHKEIRNVIAECKRLHEIVVKGGDKSLFNTADIMMELIDYSLDTERELIKVKRELIKMCKLLDKVEIYLEDEHEAVKQVAISSFIEGIKYFKKSTAKLNSAKSHAETNQIKQEVLKHYAENKHKFKSKDEAAFYYVKREPLKFSTIRNYLKNQ